VWYAHYGVRVDNGVQRHPGNHITKIRDDPFSAARTGVAVLVGRQVEGTIGSAKIVARHRRLPEETARRSTTRLPR